MTPLQSLVAAGTKLWLDSVDPDLVDKNIALGATGATSNPIIISDLLKTGRFDSTLECFFDEGMSDEQNGGAAKQAEAQMCTVDRIGEFLAQYRFACHDLDQAGGAHCPEHLGEDRDNRKAADIRAAQQPCQNDGYDE